MSQGRLTKEDLDPRLVEEIKNNSTRLEEVDERNEHHTNDLDNPHGVTAEQLALGNVQNFGVANQAEAESGTSTTKYMTPQRTKQAIDKNLVTISQSVNDLEEQVTHHLNDYAKNIGTSEVFQGANSQAEKQYFRLRNADEWDFTENAKFTLGAFSTTANNKAICLKALDETPSGNFSLQAEIYLDGTQIGAFLGFTNSLRGSVPTDNTFKRRCGFSNEGFVYFNGTSNEVLIPKAELTPGWYTVNIIASFINSTIPISISLQKVGTTKSKTFRKISSVGNNNMFIEAANENDKIRNVKYFSTGNLDLPFLFVPNLDISRNHHTAYESIDVKGIKIFAHIPASYRSNGKSKCVLYVHGSRATGGFIWTDAQTVNTMKALLDAGYVVLSSDYSSWTNWGNEQSVNDTDNIINYFKKFLNIQEKFYVIGHSMGGVTALNSIAKSNSLQDNVKAVVGIFPATNLSALYANGNGELANDIANAYGINHSSEYNAKTNGYDPMLIDINKFKNIPMLFWHSPEDTVIPKATNSDAFAERINNNGGSIEVIATTGEHGDVSNFDAAMVLNFFNTH